MNNNTQPYRRQYERYKAEGEATLILDNVPMQPSLLKDLSGQGAGIVINRPLKKDSQVRVCLRAPMFIRGEVQRKARVVWCNRLDGDLWQAGLELDRANPLNLEL